MTAIDTIDDAILAAEKVKDWKLHEDEDIVIIFPAYSKRYDGSVDNLKITIDKETMLFSSDYSIVVHSGNATLFESQPSDKIKLKAAYNKINLEFLYQKAKQTAEAAHLATFKNE